APPIPPAKSGGELEGAGIRLARNSYFILRVGDAGLLVAILMLMEASGTLSISPALEFAVNAGRGTGGVLDTASFYWIVAGFLLAVWVKLGGWPFHIWSQSGRRLSLASQTWLYATVMPNLGTYLLYRVTPLLALAGPLRTAAFWLGAGGSALAALMALTQADLRAALVYLGAAQGGLALFTAASGVKPVVWLGLLAITPLRLLMFLAADVARQCESPSRRRIAAWCFALGGLATVSFGLLTTWWARGTGAPLDALFVAEAAVALTGVWAVLVARQLSHPSTRDPRSPAVHWTRWVVVGLLGAGVLAGGLTWAPLAQHLAQAGHMTLPPVPTLPTLVRYAATAPALLMVVALALATWRLQRRSRFGPLVSSQPAGEVYDLQEGLTRAAQTLHAVIEVGIAEQIIALSAQVLVDGARVTHRFVETGGLEGLLARSVRVVVDGAHVAHSVVEQEGLEGLLRRIVEAVLTLSRTLQRWHTGKLRRNLLWVTVSLALAVLALVLYGG
ncbi:MAG: proton-conducting transporter membrane subunit, partial [Chloroflexota bacterium]|nr:proton-conducting transporter membrane subunit [Chloroflexota bacterium]